MLLSTIIKLITGNQTEQAFVEEFYESYEIGPNRGIVLCDSVPVTSGPHYLVIFECRQFTKNKKGHQQLVSVFE